MTSKPKGRTIQLEVRIQAPRDAVWAALTEASELSRWFPPVATGKPGLGEQLSFSWGDLHWETHVVGWEPGRHLVWQDKPHQAASSEEDAAPPMAVDWTLDAAGGEVRVRLVQSGFGEGDSWEDFYQGTDFGWRFYLHALRHYLERHPGKERAMAWVRRLAKGASSVPWGKLWSSEGFAPTPEAAQFASARPIQLSLGAERLPARVDFVQAPRGLWATLPSLQDATLLVEMEPGEEERHAGVWLSTYGLPKERVAELQSALTALVDRVLPAPS